LSVIKRPELAPLLARWPESLRLLLLAGPDESSSTAHAQATIAALSDAADPMAVTLLGADQLKADPGRLADEAAAIAMFGGRRVIRVDAGGSATDAEQATEAVRLLLAAPAGSGGNPVVMVAGDLGKTSALRRLVETAPDARILLSYSMTPREAEAWATDHARSLGLALAPGVAPRLAEAAALDIGIMGRELEKFALYLGATPDAGAPQRLEPAHLDALGAGLGEEDMGALMAAILAGNRVETVRQLGLLPPGDGIRLTRQLARKLMQLLELRQAIDAGASPESAAKALRPPLFWRDAQPMAAAAARWPQPMIARALASLLAAEAGIKAPASPGDMLALQPVALMAAGAARRHRANSSSAGRLGGGRQRP
jgi:DNA polymerase-3 subunit delta